MLRTDPFYFNTFHPHTLRPVFYHIYRLPFLNPWPPTIHSLKVHMIIHN